MTQQAKLIRALLQPSVYPHSVGRVEHLETHISHLLLAGEYAYKIKKPVNLGFLDFTHIERRHHYCQEEMRLNRRLAAPLYKGVVAITGTDEHPVLDGNDAPALEYAVKMRRFSADSLLTDVIQRDALTAAHVDAMASELAHFHLQLPPAEVSSGWGKPAAVDQNAMDNFQQTKATGVTGSHEPLISEHDLDKLKQWSQQAADTLAGHFEQRRHKGWIRECHGDLHLANYALINDRPMAFDALEFSPALRWIDVISELAFVFMDLLAHGKSHYAWRLLDRWLQETGDYEGLHAMPYYLVYRAMVRVKVAALRHEQSGDVESAQACRRYFKLARQLARPGKPQLILMHGLSGSGKSYVSQRLVERLGAVRLRSDVERKRLHPGITDPETLYGAEASRKTFGHLRRLCGQLLSWGYMVILDATSLRSQHRQQALAVAQTQGLPWSIVSVETDDRLLRQRLQSRRNNPREVSDADYHVVQQQRQEMDSFSISERAQLIEVDGAKPDMDKLCEALNG